jgi:hypothetical protein
VLQGIEVLNMALKIPDLGIVYKMTLLQTNFETDALEIHLYQNNYTPTTSSVLADFTAATFDGYIPQTISGWSSPTVTAHVGLIQATAVVFTKAAGATPNSIYGYYVTDSGGTTVLWAELFSTGPFAMSATGSTITVTPTMTDQSL